MAQSCVALLPPSHLEAYSADSRSATSPTSRTTRSTTPLWRTCTTRAAAEDVLTRSDSRRPVSTRICRSPLPMPCSSNALARPARTSTSEPRDQTDIYGCRSERRCAGQEGVLGGGGGGIVRRGSVRRKAGQGQGRSEACEVGRAGACVGGNVMEGRRRGGLQGSSEGGVEASVGVQGEGACMWWGGRTGQRERDKG